MKNKNLFEKLFLTNQTYFTKFKKKCIFDRLVMKENFMLLVVCLWTFQGLFVKAGRRGVGVSRRGVINWNGNNWALGPQSH